MFGKSRSSTGRGARGDHEAPAAAANLTLRSCGVANLISPRSLKLLFTLYSASMQM